MTKPQQTPPNSQGLGSLNHYSTEPLNNFALLGRASGNIKPIGLWVSADDYEMSWPEWCWKEHFYRHDSFKYRTPIKIKAGANVLWIKSPEDMEDFQERYAYNLFPDIYNRPNHIDWCLVRRDFDGVIIAPYQWEFRLAEDFFWYYGWDCASGCIWSPEAVEIGASEPYDFDAAMREEFSAMDLADEDEMA